MYIDESGNTGSNLFDEAQPCFYSLGTLSREDLSNIPECLLARNILEVDELHGNELGLTRVSEISKNLINIIREYDLHFLCSEIDKIYFGKMKFFDVLFDSGTNPGVGSHHCFIRPLKFLMMIRFAELVTVGELKHFWKAYSQRDTSSFKALMENMVVRVEDYDTDKRTKELLLDCYRGAMSAAEDVLCAGLLNADSPNVTSFIMFIHEMNKLFDGNNVFVSEVVHDTQEEFGISIEESYGLLSEIKITWNLAEFGHKQVKVFSPNFSTCDSNDCDGLQLSDVFLYLHKKAHDITLKGPAKSLYEVFVSRLHCLFMTKEGLWSETEADLRKIYAKPMSSKDYKNGAKLLEELDSKRKTKLVNNI